MKTSYDVVIVGGAVIGSAVAYFLAANPRLRRLDPGGRARPDLSQGLDLAVVLLDPQPVLQPDQCEDQPVRQRSSSAISRETMQVGDDRPDLGFHEGGYLFLANTEEQDRDAAGEPRGAASPAAPTSCCGTGSELADAFPHLARRRHPARLLRPLRRGLVQQHRPDERLPQQGARARRRLSRPTRSSASAARATASPRSTLKSGAVDRGRHDRQRLRTARGADGAHGRPRRSGRAAQAHALRLRLRQDAGGDGAGQPAAACPLMIDPTGVFCRPEGRFFLSGCRAGRGSRRRLGRLRAALRGVRGHHLAGAGRALARLRGDQGRQPVGRPLRLQHARPQPRRRPPPAGDELHLRQRLLGPRPAAGSGGGARRLRADRLWRRSARSTCPRSATNGSSKAGPSWRRR